MLFSALEIVLGKGALDNCATFIQVMFLKNIK
jgi:hypothetical protein